MPIVASSGSGGGGIDAGPRLCLQRRIPVYRRGGYTKWDKEWLRYLTLDKDYSFYFWDLSSDRYILNHSKEKLRGYDREWWSTERLYKSVGAGIFVDGVDVVDKVVLEMGCGPGIFGRLATRFSQQYIGLDISQFALSIAKLTSQPSAVYIHLSEVDLLKKLEKIADTCVDATFSSITTTRIACGS